MATERLNEVWLVGTTWWQGCGELLLKDNRFCKAMAVSQAFIFHFKCYSILHFAVCQLLCWAFLYLTAIASLFYTTIGNTLISGKCRRNRESVWPEFRSISSWSSFSVRERKGMNNQRDNVSATDKYVNNWNKYSYTILISVIFFVMQIVICKNVRVHIQRGCVRGR